MYNEIGSRSGDTNLYNYVVSDPVNLINPDGKFPIPLVLGILAGVFYATDTDTPGAAQDEMIGVPLAVAGGWTAGGGVCKATNTSVQFRTYPNAGGGGVGLYRNAPLPGQSSNIIRFDLHKIPQGGQQVYRPHVDIPGVVKHWPWGNKMDDVNNRFIQIVDDILIRRETSIEDFHKKWQAVIGQNRSRISSGKLVALADVAEMIEDALTHMPGKGLLSNEIDWSKWCSESDALLLVVIREALGFNFDSSSLKGAMNGLGRFSGIQPPYVGNADVQKKIRVHLESVFPVQG